MTVRVDFAGLYFSIEVPFVQNETIRGLLLRIQTITGAPGYVGPRAEFYEEEYSADGLTLDGVTITHRNGSAKSRQLVKNAAGQLVGKRQYDNGIYHFSDDSVGIDAANPLRPLRPADPNKAFVSAWQYYVYDEQGRDLARLRPTPPGTAMDPDREIVPFSDPSTIPLVMDGYTIVWRLVTIFVRPTHADRGDLRFSIKNTVKLA